MWFRVFLASFLTLLLGAFASHAALSKYRVRTTNLTEYNFNSPLIEIMTGQPHSGDPFGTALIDNDGGSGSPALQKFVLVSGGLLGTTVDLPGLSGFIYIKQGSKEFPLPNQIGTGQVASTIEWGVTTGWTITGGSFCNAVPSYICDSAMRADDETVPPPFTSSKYDIGEWRFHGTGFRGDPRLVQTNTRAAQGGLGNFQSIPRGVKRQDGTVPALPFIGMLAVGASVVAMGIATLRQRR